jgi:hypothetical protein
MAPAQTQRGVRARPVGGACVNFPGKIFMPGPRLYEVMVKPFHETVLSNLASPEWGFFVRKQQALKSFIGAFAAFSFSVVVMG